MIPAPGAVRGGPAVEVEPAGYGDPAPLGENLAARIGKKTAELAKGLRIRIEAVIDPSDAITNVLGPRPTTQRERLEWDRAIEGIVVYTEQTDWSPPTDARTFDELLGPRPPQDMDRLHYDSVAAAIDQAIMTPERDLGMELDLGLP